MMINISVFLLAVAFPAAIGWMTLLILEKGHPVLGKKERWFWALIIGPTFFACIVFLSHALGLTRLTLVGFLTPSLLLFAALGTVAWKMKAFAVHRYTPVYTESSTPSSPLLKSGIALLILWTVIKVFAGAYDLVSVPTYWDDSFNNWNMRGKMYFETGNLLLEIPVGNGIVQSVGGVGSYPPSLPLLKTWVSVLRGDWQEPLVNGLHLIWLVGMAGSFFFALRRRFSPLWSLGGVYLLLSLPMIMIHATNPYADVFVASHLFLTISCLLLLSEANNSYEVRTWSKLFALCLGLLLFTKNEATVLYAPVLAALFFLVLLRARRMQVVTLQETRRLLGYVVLIIACLALPWLGFKWFHGLSFGNAKSVSGMVISYHPKVLQAIWYHFSHEPNWLFVPLLVPALILYARKNAFRFPLGILTLYVMTVTVMQCLIFLFTPLATEAIMQTGIARGFLHTMPIAIFLLCLLIKDQLSAE